MSFCTRCFSRCWRNEGSEHLQMTDEPSKAVAIKDLNPRSSCPQPANTSKSVPTEQSAALEVEVDEQREINRQLMTRERDMKQYIQLLQQELERRSSETVVMAAKMREMEMQLMDSQPDEETSESTSQAAPEPYYIRRILDNYKDLLEKLDAGKTAKQLFQRRALNKKEFEEIRSLSSEQPTKAAEQLLKLVLSQSEDFHDCFLDSLLKTDQTHVHQWIVLEDYDPEVESTAWIRDHYVFLLDTLDSVCSGLIVYLYQSKVVDQEQYEDVRTERTSARQNERLLSFLGRKSPEEIQLFFDALDESGQSHIRNTITGRNEDVDRREKVQSAFHADRSRDELLLREQKLLQRLAEVTQRNDEYRQTVDTRHEQQFSRERRPTGTVEEFREIERRVEDLSDRYQKVKTSTDEVESRIQRAHDARQELQSATELLTAWMEEAKVDDTPVMGLDTAALQQGLNRTKVVTVESSVQKKLIDKMRAAAETLKSVGADDDSTSTLVDSIGDKFEQISQSTVERCNELQAAVVRSQTERFEELRPEVVRWLEEKEKESEDFDPVAVDVELINAQMEQIKVLLSEYLEFAVKIDELNEVGSSYDVSLKGIEIATSVAHRFRRRGISHMLTSPLGISSVHPGLTSPGFTSTESAASSTADMSETARHLLDVNNRYETLGQTLSERHSELEMTTWLGQKEKMISFLGPLTVEPVMVEKQIQQLKLLKEELQGPYENFIQQEYTIHDNTDPDSPDSGVISPRLDAVSTLWDKLETQLGEREATLTYVLDAGTQFHDTMKTLVEWLTLAADSVDAFSELDTADQLKQFKLVDNEAEEKESLVDNARQHCERLCDLITESSIKHDLNNRLALVEKSFTDLKKKLDLNGPVQMLHRYETDGEVFGATQLQDVVYIVCARLTAAIMRFSARTHQRLTDVTIRNLGVPCDIAACEQTSVVYVTDAVCVCRVSTDGEDVKRWLPKSSSDTFKPDTLSVTSSRLLVTSLGDNQLRQFDAVGHELKRVDLPDDMEPRHAIESGTATFIVSHYNTQLKQDQVSEVNTGGQVLRQFSGSRLLPLGYTPHVAVDSRRNVFIADCGNRRILLLHSELALRRVIIDEHQLNYKEPQRLCYIEQLGQLLVGFYYGGVKVFDVLRR